MVTLGPLEYVSHNNQRFDATPAIDQAHSSLSKSLHITVAESQSMFIEAGSLPSPHDTVIVAVARSSLAVNEAEASPSLEVATAEKDSEIKETDHSSYGSVAETGLELDDDSNLSTVYEPVGVFPFQDLAPEIRNRIYGFVLGPPQDPSVCLTEVLDNRPLRAPSGDVDSDNTFRTKTVVPNPEHEDPEWGVIHQVTPNDLSILLVCKQIFVEAFHVFYTTNCFSFTDTGQLYRFLKNIGYIRRQHLTTVYFLWRGPDAREAFRLLKTCRRLRTVQFTVPCSHPPGYEALKEVRVETAKARALVHFARDRYSHTSCFGDYLCHCACRRLYDPPSSLRELENAMMTPRRVQDLPDLEEKFDLFKPKREYFPKSEEQSLLADKDSFEHFIARIEQQGKELRYLGRRNKIKEAALNQTLQGSDVDDYFRDFAEKLAKDKRLAKMKERWHAKRQEEQEAEELRQRWKKEAVEAKELGIKTRREARELRWKIARETKAHEKKVAREARELKRRTAREAKEREKMMAREAKAQKKAAKGSKGPGRKTTNGTERLGSGTLSASN